jgi:hypothetical protein
LFSKLSLTFSCISTTTRWCSFHQFFITARFIRWYYWFYIHLLRQIIYLLILSATIKQKIRIVLIVVGFVRHCFLGNVAVSSRLSCVKRKAKNRNNRHTPCLLSEPFKLLFEEECAFIHRLSAANFSGLHFHCCS